MVLMSEGFFGRNVMSGQYSVLPLSGMKTFYFCVLFIFEF